MSPSSHPPEMGNNNEMQAGNEIIANKKRCQMHFVWFCRLFLFLALLWCFRPLFRLFRKGREIDRFNHCSSTTVTVVEMLDVD